MIIDLLWEKNTTSLQEKSFTGREQAAKVILWQINEFDDMLNNADFMDIRYAS